MKEEEKTKSFNKKWLIAIVLIAVILIAIAFYTNILSLPTGLATGTTETTPSATEAPGFTITGNEYFAKEIATTKLPYSEPIDLEVGRYQMQVITDKPVWILLYSETNYNEWKNGVYGVFRSGTGCCLESMKTTNYDNIFDINKGNLNIVKYYLVIEGSAEASVKIKIRQLLKF